MSKDIIVGLADVSLFLANIGEKEYHKTIEDACNFIQKRQWIPISERTPEPEGLFSGSYVIVCDKYGQVFPARYVKRILREKEIIRWHKYDFRTYDGPDIVAWMPKPEKYIGGEK